MLVSHCWAHFISQPSACHCERASILTLVFSPEHCYTPLSMLTHTHGVITSHCSSKKALNPLQTSTSTSCPAAHTAEHFEAKNTYNGMYISLKVSTKRRSVNDAAANYLFMLNTSAFRCVSAAQKPQESIR